MVMHVLIRGLGRSPGDGYPLQYSSVSLVAQMVKNLPAVWETWVQSLGWEDLEEGMQPTPVFLPGESHGQRSLVGYSPWGRKELDKTECLSIAHNAHLGPYGQSDGFSSSRVQM